jgi:hypothetical protein
MAVVTCSPAQRSVNWPAIRVQSVALIWDDGQLVKNEDNAPQLFFVDGVQAGQGVVAGGRRGVTSWVVLRADNFAGEVVLNGGEEVNGRFFRGNGRLSKRRARLRNWRW